MLRVAGLIALWLVCLTIALANAWNAMWIVVYVLGLLLVLSFGWAQLNVSGLELRRRHRGSRLTVGDVLSEQVVLEAQPGLIQWLPRLWLELHDRTDLPGHQLDRVLTLGPIGHRVWELRSTLIQRGRFTLGPVAVTSGDPFGLFRASRELSEGSSIVVYPRAIDLAGFGRVPGQLPGRGPAGRARALHHAERRFSARIPRRRRVQPYPLADDRPYRPPDGARIRARPLG